MMSKVGKAGKIAFGALIMVWLLAVFCAKTEGYTWPIGDGETHHWVSGTLGEYREPDGGTNPCYKERHFHDAMDLRTATSNRKVYGVESGGERAQDVSETGHYVVGELHDYRHVENIQVEEGEDLYNYTRIGDYQAGALDHVHFSDEYNTGTTDCDLMYNPMNYLVNYSDNLDPSIVAIRFIADERPDIVFGGSPPIVSGDVDIVVWLRDAVLPGGSNNGIYEAGWYIDDPPPQWTVWFWHVDEWDDVDLVYVHEWVKENPAQDHYWYKVTNRPDVNGYWRTTGYDNGDYRVCIVTNDGNGNEVENCFDATVDNPTGVTEGEQRLGPFPNHYELIQSQPNPFYAHTRIRFSIPNIDQGSGTRLGPVHVSLRICDVTGRVVRTLVSSYRWPGRHVILWDGKDDNKRMLPGGSYFYTINVDGFTETKKMILLR